MTNILITGGTGYLGKHLLDKIYNNNHDWDILRVVARDEGNLIRLKSKYPQIEIVPGDIADLFVASQAVKDIDICYHLAAFKHAVIAEQTPYQCINTNIIGTINLLQQFSGPKFVAMSTDKVSNLAGVYGTTKYLMEKIVKQYAILYPFINFEIIRCGNIIYSTGSVLELWKDALLNGNPVTITDENATRFLFTVNQAVNLILEDVVQWPNKSVRMGDLLEAMQNKYGRATQINKIGLQPGENLHEVLELIEGHQINSNETGNYSIYELEKMI